MSGEWVEVSGRPGRPLSWSEMGTLLLAPNVMVVSYVYLSMDHIPTLFPPPSTIEVPLAVLAKQCAAQGTARA